MSLLHTHSVAHIIVRVERVAYTMLACTRQESIPSVQPLFAWNRVREISFEKQFKVDDLYTFDKDEPTKENLRWRKSGATGNGA